ncbi:hypothetical protein ANN_09921 [Periplaneta americana]|uniref:V-type proton ATPase subunit a n=1 Tax=Periplaneta americana TaxID=6978 RepID=A0ABQ8TMZ6_PERAM|nr:hypothetical protein ANN_09921 [Periplaneta americana]
MVGKTGVPSKNVPRSIIFFHHKFQFNLLIRALVTSLKRVKAGVILQDKIAAFQQMLWRVCRGNIYFQFKPIETPTEDPVLNIPVYNSVFILFFQGDALNAKIKKICAGFKATIYYCPEDMAERERLREYLMVRMEDAQLVLNRTSEQNHRILLACARNLKMYFLKVLKMKSVYFTLNMCNVDVKSSYLIAQCWMPISSVSSVNKALITGTEKSGSTLPPVMSKINTTDIPPTYNPTNKFTKVFQDLIDAYGYSSYGEINPVVFTTVTFPFLFAVMFGDVGHGILLTCAGLMIWINEKRINWDKTGEDMGGVIVGGRRIKCIRFADDVALLAEEEMILRDMLLELNDNCEQYGMKINVNKTKTMIIGRKVKKVKFLILNEATEQVDSFK